MFLTNCSLLCKYSFVLFSAIAASVLTSSQAHILEFTVEPSDTVVEVGQKAVLDCVVKASYHQSSVLIEWLDQDGQKINFIGDSYRSQLTNGSLYINNVNEEQQLTGIYQCMASLPNVGKIISRTAKLSIANLKGFVEEPSDITVYLRQRAHFACKALAWPSPKIKWLKDERPLQLDELRMTILPTGALEIDEVLESDQGSYRCNASSLSSYKLSNKATLVINGDTEQAHHVSPPTFIAKPQSDIAIEGQNISLDCAVNGNPKPVVTWLKDGKAIDMNYLDSRFSMVGSTTSLRITTIQEQDAGSYLCRAENREDILDASAQIQVQVPPKFLRKPQDKIEFANKDAEFECAVYGIPEPRVQWFKNGEILTINEYYQIVNGYNLKIMGLMSSDSALFQCFASNPAGTIQAAASLKVTPTGTRKKHKNKKANHRHNPLGNKDLNPELKPLNLNKSQLLNMFTSLKSDSNGKLGEVDFGHLRNRNNPSSLSSGNSHNSSLYDPSGLDPLTVFSSLKSSEAEGDARNNLGDVLSAYSSTPNRSQRPISADSSEIGQEDGLPSAPRDLKATVTKARFIVLSWKPPLINGDNVEEYAVYYRQEGSERERVQSTNKTRLEDISIGSLIPGRVYHFRVVAINSAGSGVSSKNLSVTTQSEEHVPSPPEHFTAYAIGPRSIHVSWRPPEVTNGEIHRYVVYYMETRSLVEHNIETTELKCNLTDLSIYTEYSVWVVAVNQNGPGTATYEKTVRTFSASPSEPPQNVTVEASSSTSVTVRWEPPPLEAQNGIITGYKIRYRIPGSKGITISTQGNKKVLTGLERRSAYQIKLWAMNVNGTSPGSEWYTIETFENDLDESRVPDIPGPLRVRPASDKLYVWWSPPANQNIKVRNYILAWGRGVPDTYEHELDADTRSHVIERLEPNSEYVISLRASNMMGAGAPVYNTVTTHEELPPEPQLPLTPPMGLKAQVLGETSVILYWTDTTLSKSQYVSDDRFYIVKYTLVDTMKSRTINTTELHQMIDDLKPGTMYEFSVKLMKGRKESPWSMVVTNTTWDVVPSTAPRELQVTETGDESQLVELTWQPPKAPSGSITGYVIMYTDNSTKSDREWFVQAIKGDKRSFVFTDLQPLTTYFFKIKVRNTRSYGPYSNVISFTTGANVRVFPSKEGQKSDRAGLFSGHTLMYLIICSCILVMITVITVSVILCRRRGSTTTSPDRSKKGYQKGSQSIKPPDLWIHHDQMELKAMEKGGNNDGASSSGAMTLPRSIGGNDYEVGNHAGTNSLDKRTYVPSYVGTSSDDTLRRSVKSKPITLPVDSKPPREPIATPINTTTLSQTSSDSTPSSRPPYPRTTYSLSRAHVAVDGASAPTVESPYGTHTPGHCYEPGTLGFSSQPPQVAHVPASAYAPGMGILAEQGKRLTTQGHPLKSFTVPAPPPISAPGTPKHMVTVRPTSSPYKKVPSSSSSTLTSTPPSRISVTNPPPHTNEEIQKLQPSNSTEELNQEMANLEGLMLTLNAITTSNNEFEC